MFWWVFFCLKKELHKKIKFLIFFHNEIVIIKKTLMFDEEEQNVTFQIKKEEKGMRKFMTKAGAIMLAATMAGVPAVSSVIPAVSVMAAEESKWTIAGNTLTIPDDAALADFMTKATPDQKKSVWCVIIGDKVTTIPANAFSDMIGDWDGEFGYGLKIYIPKTVQTVEKGFIGDRHASVYYQGNPLSLFSKEMISEHDRLIYNANGMKESDIKTISNWDCGVEAWLSQEKPSTIKYDSPDYDAELDEKYIDLCIFFKGGVSNDETTFLFGDGEFVPTSTDNPDNPGTDTPDNPGTDTPDNPGTDTPDNPGTDTGKDDTSKDDTSKDDTGKDDTGKDDAGKDDTGKDDTGKDDAGKDDTGKDDTGKDDAGNGGTDNGGTGNGGTGNGGTGSTGGTDVTTPKPAETTVVKNGVTYTMKSDGTAKATKGKKNITKVVIPSKVDIAGKSVKVTEVSKNSFKNQKKLKTVTIGKNVKKIGANAFKGDKKLKKLTIKSKKLTNIGKKAFKSAGTKKSTAKVPNSKKKVLKKMLKKAGFKGTVR